MKTEDENRSNLFVNEPAGAAWRASCNLNNVNATDHM